jgi:hypothetical protein
MLIRNAISLTALCNSVRAHKGASNMAISEIVDMWHIVDALTFGQEMLPISREIYSEKLFVLSKG